MYIQEAIKKAVEGKKYITYGKETIFKIKPTNDAGNCVLMNPDGSHPSKYGWQPKAEDLMRSDWKVID